MIDLRTEENIRQISADTSIITAQLQDIALSLRLLSGRTSHKREILEGEIKGLENSIKYMEEDSPLFGEIEFSTKIQELKTSLAQKYKELASEEERIQNEANN